MNSSSLTPSRNFASFSLCSFSCGDRGCVFCENPSVLTPVPVFLRKAVPFLSSWATMPFHNLIETLERQVHIGATNLYPHR